MISPSLRTLASNSQFIPILIHFTLNLISVEIEIVLLVVSLKMLAISMILMRDSCKAFRE